MRGQLAGLCWVGSGREHLVLVPRNSKNPETETRKPAAVYASCMSNRNHQHPANQTQIITDVADWAALWYPRTGKFLNACFRTEPQAYRALLCAGIFKMPDASCQRYSVTSAQRACDEGLDARHVAVRR